MSEQYLPSNSGLAINNRTTESVTLNCEKYGPTITSSKIVDATIDSLNADATKNIEIETQNVDSQRKVNVESSKATQRKILDNEPMEKNTKTNNKQISKETILQHTEDAISTSPQVLSTEPQSSTSSNIKSAEHVKSSPKSNAQADEINTATSTVSSPKSADKRTLPENPDLDTQSTVTAESTKSQQSNTDEVKLLTDTASVQALPIQELPATVNGKVPKSGKPLVTALSKKLNKITAGTSRSRKQKPSLTLYESEISDNKVGIKLCIKKSDSAASTPVESPMEMEIKSKTPKMPAATIKQARKRARKTREKTENANEPRKKKSATTNNNNSSNVQDVLQEPINQSVWGEKLPEEVLFHIFQMVVDKEGCLPTLFRLGRVCSLWRQVSLRPSLWRSMDLTTWIKEKYRTELKLKWFVDNRCSSCTDLNVSNWKVSDINCFLTKLASGCPNLVGITLSGWKGFTCDHLAYLVEHMKKLERLDLSSINVEMSTSKSAVGVQSLCSALQGMGSRLTHLYLAHNRLAGLPQIVNTLAKYCPNLALLDLSNVTTQATSHGVLHIEKLQHGCQKLKVLRVTNSHVTPSTAGLQEMMDSPGFPDLEELSVAALTDESRIISDDHLQRILKQSSKLKLLDVRNCTRLTHESLIRLPAWDIKHLFLSGCSITRDIGSGLELIASKWAHSLIELDLAWANVQQPLDNALRALAEKGNESPLAHLNLCGSSVSEEAVKDILANCANMSSINLASCRGLPRGVKRLIQGPRELHELREVLKVQMKVKLPKQFQNFIVKDESGSGSKT